VTSTEPGTAAEEPGDKALLEEVVDSEAAVEGDQLLSEAAQESIETSAEGTIAEGEEPKVETLIEELEHDNLPQVQIEADAGEQDPAAMRAASTE